METLLSALRESEEYLRLQKIAETGGSAALSGLSPIIRAHFIAALCRDLNRPALIVCHDEESARTTQEALQSFLDVAFLPSRDLTFYDVNVISRGWEQRRLRQFHRLASGKINILVTSLRALTTRTIPKAVLQQAAPVLEPGGCYEINELSDR